MKKLLLYIIVAFEFILCVKIIGILGWWPSQIKGWGFPACVIVLIAFTYLMKFVDRHIPQKYSILKSISFSTYICVGLIPLSAIGMYFINFLIFSLPDDEEGGYGFHCTACDDGYINPIISENNVVLDLSKGKELKKYDGDAWQSCGCRKVVSFEENPNYAIKQIFSMDNYWTEYDNCQDFLKPYSIYAKEVDFNADGPCYTHVQTINDEKDVPQDIVIVYDKRTNHLFYHYDRP